MADLLSSADLISLVTVQAAESIVLEFKAAPWGKSDSEKRECLKDISALANTSGGKIIVGISEAGNAANSFLPIAADQAEMERGRINDLLVAGLEPRLYGVSIQTVEIDGGVVLVVSVPRSAARPHRVSSGGSNRFWLRNSTGTYEANVSDLRAMFLQGAEISDRAIQHHRGRVQTLFDGEIVSNLLSSGHFLFLSVIPAESFSGAVLVEPIRANEVAEKFRPIAATDGYSSTYTFDGFLNHRSAAPCHGYTLVRRSGIVEAVKMKVTNFDTFPIQTTESRLILPTYRYLQGLQHLGIAPPYYVMATICGAEGMNVVFNGHLRDTDKVTRNILHLPGVVIEDQHSTQAVAAAFRPAIDALWNAIGRPKSPSYDGGHWKQLEPED